MKLRVLTLNVWALPAGLASDVAPRLEFVAQQLPALGTDVACFQEVWTREAQEILVAGARAAGLEHVWSSGPRRGGLLVASRFRLAGARFEEFRVRGLREHVWRGDYLSGKGWVELGLETPSGVLALVATHLHAQYRGDDDDTYRWHRMAQVVQLASRLRQIHPALVAVGDFNLRPDQPHYEVLIGLTGIWDAAVRAGHTEATVLDGNPYRGEEAAERIDYVFARSGGGQYLEIDRIERVFDGEIEIDGHAAAPSDHAGLVADLELTEGRTGIGSPVAGALESARLGLEAGLGEAHARRDRRRALAGAGLGGGLLAWALARRQPVGRRSALRALAVGAGLVAVPVGIGSGLLSEWDSPAEVEGFESGLRELDALADGPGAGTR